jgi:hypothetical protein
VIFQEPRKIDTTQTVEFDTPEAWASLIHEKKIRVLPLVNDIHASGFPGWVSYRETVSDSPDVEIFSGGVNEKPDIGAALWRQGQFLHFGFESSPQEMNDTGRALLVNSIAYIARFHQDRALCVSPSPFAGVSIRSRAKLARWLESEDTPLDWFTAAIEPDLLSKLPADRAAYRKWFETHRDWLHPNELGLLALDADAKALGVGYDRPEMFATACAALAEGGERARHASAVLARYVPDGPGAAANAETWRAWLDAHKPYLFFSEWGGYRWYVDALAQHRGVPSTDLRGADRADK